MMSVMMVMDIIMIVNTNQDPTSPHGSIPPFLRHRPPCIESFLVKGKKSSYIWSRLSWAHFQQGTGNNRYKCHLATSSRLRPRPSLVSRSTVSTIKSCLHTEENNDCPCVVVMFDDHHNEKYACPFHHNYNGDKTGWEMMPAKRF